MNRQTIVKLARIGKENGDLREPLEEIIALLESSFYSSIIIEPMKKLKTLVFLLISISSYADYDPCRYIKTSHCKSGGSVNKAVGASSPTSSSSISRPSLLSSVKGLGVEGILFHEVDLSLVTGNGKIGAGVSGANSDDTFFGNTAKELTSDYEARVSLPDEENPKYRYKKYTLATGFRLWTTKKKFFTVNLGVMGKYIEETSNIYPGGGISFGLGPLNIGYSRYRDEGIKRQLDANGEREAEIFDVDSYSLGLNLPFISFDYTFLNNHIDDRNEEVHIYSGGLIISKLMMTYGRRLEKSERRKYDHETNLFDSRNKNWSTFYGLQYRLGKHISAGLLYNYYLTNEGSVVVTGFF